MKRAGMLISALCAAGLFLSSLSYIVLFPVLFYQEVAFDMRRFFVHKDQRAVVMYILGCMRLIDIYV